MCERQGSFQYISTNQAGINIPSCLNKRYTCGFCSMRVLLILRKGERKGCAAIAVGVIEELALALLIVANRAVLSVALIKQRRQVKLQQISQLGAKQITGGSNDRF